MTDDKRKELESLRMRLKTGQYNVVGDIMSAWLAIDQLLACKSGKSYAKDSAGIKKIEWCITPNDPGDERVDQMISILGNTPFGAFRICSMILKDITINYIHASPLTKNLSIYTTGMDKIMKKCEDDYREAVLRALETEDDTEEIPILHVPETEETPVLQTLETKDDDKRN